ncbi:MAG: hypothetical protein Q9179_004102 [Wetmoreana sp. 5 TL-2023]
MPKTKIEDLPQIQIYPRTLAALMTTSPPPKAESTFFLENPDLKEVFGQHYILRSTSNSNRVDQ